MASPAAVMEILVRANTTAANAGLAKTEAQLAGAGAAAGKTTTATQKTGAALRKMGTIAKYGAAAGVAGFVIAAKKSVDTTNELTKSTLLLQKNFGLSGKAASEWAGVARARGVDSTKLGMAFKTLATQISSAAHGSDTAKEMFKELGFSQADIAKSMKDTQFAVGEVAAGFQHLPPGMEKATLAGKLFGRGWQSIFPVLRDGKAAMQEQLDTVEKYGGVIAGKTLKQQEEFLAAQRETKIAWQGMEVTLGTALTPALTDANEQFQKIARVLASDKLTSDQKFSKVAHLLSTDFNKALDLILDHVDEVAEQAGQAGLKIAGGLVKGFLNSDVWGQVAIGAFLISKMGGWGAISALGTQFGTRFGTSAATAESAALAKGGGPAAVLAGGAKGSKFTRIGSTIGPIVAIPGILALLKRLKETQDTVTDSSASLGDKVKSVYGTAFPILGTEVDLADKAIHAFGGGTVHATGKVMDLNHSVGNLAMNFNDGGKAARLLRRNFGDLSMKSAQDAVDGLRDKYGTLINAGHHMSAEERKDWIDVAEAAHGKGEFTAKQLENLTGAFTHNSQKWRDQMERAAKVTGQTTKSISDSVGKAGVHVSRTYRGMVEVVGGGLDWLTTNTSKAAQALGVKEQIRFHATAAAVHGAGGAGIRAGMNLGGSVPGVGNTDSVPTWLTPGEFVVRKEQTAKHRQLLEAINAKAYAKGGVVGGDTAGLVAPFLGALHSMSGATHTPINVLSGFRTRAEQEALYARYLAGTGNLAAVPGTSVHELGKAADIAPGREVFGNVAGKFGMGFTVPSESWHIELLKAVAGLGGPPHIRRLLLKGLQGGLHLRDTGQASLDTVWRDANRYLQKKWQTIGKLNFVGGGGQFSKPELISLWSRTNNGLGDPNLMAAIALAESGGNPNARNPSGASGLWQILGQLVPGNIFDPVINAKNAAAKLRTQGLGAWSVYSSGAYQQFLNKGGQVLPYLGKYHDGGIAPQEGLAHVARGESIGRPSVKVIIHGSILPHRGYERDPVEVVLADGRFEGRVQEVIEDDRAYSNQLTRMR